MLTQSGMYVGKGATLTIDPGLGKCNLVFVSIKGTSAQPAGVFKFGTMNDTYQYTANVITGAITINADGTFTVTSDNRVGANGVIYYYTVISDSDGAGDVTTGQYVGNVTIRDIACTLNPVLVIIKSEGAQAGCFRCAGHVGVNSSIFSAAVDANQRITALGTAKFTLGTATQINNTGTVFDWIAFAANSKLAQGAYNTTASPSNPQDISTGLGSLEAVFVKSIAAQVFSIRNSAFDDTKSADIGSATLQTTDILRFLTGGIFELGADTPVNGASSTYHWYGFGRPVSYPVDYYRQRRAA